MQDEGNNLNRLCDVIGVKSDIRRPWRVIECVRRDPVGGLLYRLKHEVTGAVMLCSCYSMTNLY